MARISVTTYPPLDNNTWRYNVEVIESDGSGSMTNHKVTMNKDYYLAQKKSRNHLNFCLKGRTKIQYYSNLTLPR